MTAKLYNRPLDPEWLSLMFVLQCHALFMNSGGFEIMGNHLPCKNMMRNECFSVMKHNSEKTTGFHCEFPSVTLCVWATTKPKKCSPFTFNNALNVKSTKLTIRPIII